MFLRPLVHCLQPEVAHSLGLWALRNDLLTPARLPENPALAISAFGLDFPHPVGLAAGFDKNAEAVEGLFSQGFSFVEAGTVTPLAQPGNPRPRIFRLPEDEAVINRLGFNNHGLSVFVDNLRRLNKKHGVVGANIGKNKDSEDAIADYVRGLMAVYPYADYITVNISSPNTPGLRNLQKRDELSALLAALASARAACTMAHSWQVPLLLKVAPDLDKEERRDVAELVLQHGIDGMIISNTTISRPPAVTGEYKSEAGGLSGRPLLSLSTEVLSDFYRLTEGRIPLIGAGGVASADDAYAKIRAGATLVQLYSALVYQGFGLIKRIHHGLGELMLRDGFSHIREAIGANHRKNNS